MTTITPEQRREIEKAGEMPVRVEDPETKTAYLIVREDEYRKLREMALDRGKEPLVERGELRPREAYPAVDRTFAEGWSDPKMAEYDDYEKHRP